MQNEDETHLEAVKPPEMRLIRRLRQLHSGVHMVIIQVDEKGLLSLRLMESGKVEHLRKIADVV
jgi:hypothetical protein